jgi:hypothetical protein
MDAYVASGRIVRARPRLVATDDRTAWPRVREDSPAWRNVPPQATNATILEPVDRATVAPVVVSPSPSLAERWIAVRERWSQLTFYVSDSNAWR